MQENIAPKTRQTDRKGKEMHTITQGSRKTMKQSERRVRFSKKKSGEKNRKKTEKRSENKRKQT